MLAVIPPAANVHGSVSPRESALTIFLAVLEVAFITSSVIPSLNSATLNRTKAELALVQLIYICKIVLAMALELTIHEFSLIIAAISPLEATLSLLFAFVELTDIACATTIVPSLFTDTMLSIIFPFTCVSDALACIEESTTTSGFVIGPLPNIDITTCLNHLSATMELAVAELGFIFCAIRI